ncbi:MAG: hypothetical protein KAU62_04660 [Candidatus Heimdallarchaeota archaeon]|nr:hypothetical protein [Candidatus Heimdallarchaeota archaeon]MCK4610430.1 hypothetical protein [Candidatus Heimdallarchaeota archaeon]
MEEIKREDLVRHLKHHSNKDVILNQETIDFVLWKLNEIKHEVGIKLETKEKSPFVKAKSGR